MVASRDHQSCIWQASGDRPEGFNDWLESLVGAPFAECQYPSHRIASSGKVRVFRALRKDTVRPDMHVSASVLFHEDLAISGYENRNGVGFKKYSSSKGPCGPVQLGEAHARVFQIDPLHQMVQGHMSIAAGQPA